MWQLKSMYSCQVSTLMLGVNRPLDVMKEQLHVWLVGRTETRKGCKCLIFVYFWFSITTNQISQSQMNNLFIFTTKMVMLMSNCASRPHLDED